MEKGSIFSIILGVTVFLITTIIRNIPFIAVPDFILGFLDGFSLSILIRRHIMLYMEATIEHT